MFYLFFSNQSEDNIINKQFKSPIFKQKSIHSRSSILSIHSSGDKSVYKNSSTRAKYLRNSQKRKQIKLSSKSSSKDSKGLTNKSSILISCPIREKSRPISLKKETKKKQELSDVNSVLLRSDTGMYSVNNFSEDKKEENILESQDYNYNFHTSARSIKY